MEIDLATCTEEDLWRYVASHLAREGIETILVGGAVVSIYSEGAYRSGDLDFEHPECKHLFVEFPGSPPLGIGSDYTIKPDELTVDSHIIKILSPTDCVKDRLASFIYYKDREGLEQAILVAKRQMIDMKSVQKWCQSEGYPEAYQTFSDKLEPGKGHLKK
jgi:hypothetical protein